MPVAPARRQPDLLGATRKEIEKERSEMLAEIARMDGELEAAREGFRQGAEALEAERRAYEQTRSEAREARVLADEREKRPRRRKRSSRTCAVRSRHCASRRRPSPSGPPTRTSYAAW